ncbi:MAG: hypothetical protein MUD14_12650 [Hydrococcus sp. Prado102]|jgi:hypothetical protein|nr:hypothetical protein [Hydrococcus sp. Prado102]
MLDYPAAHSMDTEWFGIDIGCQMLIIECTERSSCAICWANYRYSKQPADNYVKRDYFSYR